MARTAAPGHVLTIALLGAAFACGGEQQTQALADASASRQDGSVAAPDAASGDGSAEGGSSGRCTIPAGATVTGDATNEQCAPHPITANGADVCRPDEYGEVCTGGSAVNPPTPDAALQCRVVPLPTPPGVVFYCCACGGAGDAAPEDDAGSGACGEVDASCGSCCTGLTCYGGRCCQIFGPCDSGSVCCETLAACISGQCVVHPQ